MNNYSIPQKILHKVVFSSKYLQEMFFDIEQSIFFKKNDTHLNNHIFITGFARSGTTTLLNAIYESDEFASLTYRDMPFILAPNLWQKITFASPSSKSNERAHADGISIDINSPEAFEEVFWKIFDQDDKRSQVLFKKFIFLILKKSNKNRYISKNNQNINRLDFLIKVFPNSKILIPFRDPLQHAFSLFSQHNNFISIQSHDKFTRSYMDWIGHSEFGLDYKMIHNKNINHLNPQELNHWLEQWHLIYEYILEFSTKNNNIHLLDYKSLCTNPNTWLQIQNMLNLSSENKFLFKESIKSVDTDYDPILTNKCYKLYKKLIDHTEFSEKN